ncbi:MAG: hypothetical protein PHF29_06280 [Candidatus Riflebacteria bacterium]|nr:hypothetical protein [Candidatus Riflebacteria bacterium]
MAKQWHQLEKLDHKALKKLQAEREKQKIVAQKAEEQKRVMIVGGIILAVILIVIAFGLMISKRSKELAYKEEREKLYISSVAEKVGNPEFRKIGLWEPVKDNMQFSEDCSFRTNEADSVTVQLQLNNLVKALGNTEMTVLKPILAEKENKVEKEVAQLTRGEVTVTIDLDGRDMLEIVAAGVTISGKSGLFKVLYNQEKDYGEVVVKNGLVEVKSSSDAPVKVSGFYKVVFSSKKVKQPVQASVIQYDWR